MDGDSIARSQIDALRGRVEDLERALSRVYEHLGLEAPGLAASSGTDVEGEVLAHLQQGDMIRAIVAYREATGADLASAKATVERIKAEHGL